MTRCMTLAVVSCCVLLAGCGVGSEQPGRSDLIGAWTGPDGATLIFAPDGRLVVRDMPQGYLWAGGGPRPVSALGAWKIEKLDGYYVGVRLPPTAGEPGIGNQIYFTKHWGRPQLFLYLSDPDQGPSYYFERAVIIPKPRELPPRPPALESDADVNG